MLDLRRGNTRLRQAWKKYTSNPVVRRVGWGVIFFLAAVFIVGSGLSSRGFSFKEGQVCPTNIYAPRTIVYVDEVETERLRRDAVSKVEKSYQEDTGVLTRLEEKVKNTFDKVRELRDAELQPAEKLQRLRTYLTQEVGVSTSELEAIPTSSLESLLQGEEQELAKAEALSKTLLQEELRYGLKADALPNAKENIVGKVSHFAITREWKPVVSAVLVRTIRPNLVFDSETYERRVAQAEAEVPIVERTYKAGQVIVREGDIITKVHLAVLRQLGLMRGRAAWPRVLGVTLFVLLIGVLIVFYLYRSRREILEREQYLILYGLLFTLTMLDL